MDYIGNTLHQRHLNFFGNYCRSETMLACVVEN